MDVKRPLSTLWVCWTDGDYQVATSLDFMFTMAEVALRSGRREVSTVFMSNALRDDSRVI